jgi:hypothetical protein
VLRRAKPDASPVDCQKRLLCGVLIPLRDRNGRRPANRCCGYRRLQQLCVRIHAPVLRSPDEQIRPCPPRCSNYWVEVSFPVSNYHSWWAGMACCVTYRLVALAFLVCGSAFGALAFCA